MTCGTADQSAQHVASALICRHDTIRNHECCRTDVVYDQTDGDILRLILFVSRMCELTYLVTQCLHRIYIKNGIYLLNNNSQTLQAHSGINIFLLEQLIVTLAIVLKLGKYVVPDFHVTVAVTAYRTARLPAAVLFSAVIVNLRTRSARSCAMLPEIVLFSKTEDTVLCDTDLLVPDIKRLIVLQVNGRIKTLRIQSDHLGQELP